MIDWKMIDIATIISIIFKSISTTIIFKNKMPTSPRSPRNHPFKPNQVLLPGALLFVGAIAQLNPSEAYYWLKNESVPGRRKLSQSQRSEIFRKSMNEPWLWAQLQVTQAAEVKEISSTICKNWLFELQETAKKAHENIALFFPSTILAAVSPSVL